MSTNIKGTDTASYYKHEILSKLHLFFQRNITLFWAITMYRSLKLVTTFFLFQWKLEKTATIVKAKISSAYLMQSSVPRRAGKGRLHPLVNAPTGHPQPPWHKLQSYTWHAGSLWYSVCAWTSLPYLPKEHHKSQIRNISEENLQTISKLTTFLGEEKLEVLIFVTSLRCVLIGQSA